MIGLQYTLENQNGESIVINDHTTNPNQIIALQQYPQFDVDIKNSELPREGQHGIWDFFSFYGRRVTSFQGVIVGASELDVETVKNQLMKVLAFGSQPQSGNDGSVLVKWTDIENKSWQISGKLMNPIQFNRSMKQNFRLDFNFSLKSADPFIVSQSLINTVGVRGYTSAGAMFPITLPLTIGTVNINELTVNNIGSADAETIIRIYGEDQGDITNPKVRNLTTGEFIQIDTVITGSTHYIEINSKEGTVVDQDGLDLSGDITTDSSFIHLKAGENLMFYTSDEDPLITLELPTALFTVKFRSTKI